MKTIASVFGTEKPIIGMLHLAGRLPEAVLQRAREEIEILYQAGVHGVLVENYFGDAVDVENVLGYLQKHYPDYPYGVCILGAPKMTFLTAQKFGAKFIQVDSVSGHLAPAYDEAFGKELKALRAKYDLLVLGGVRFMHQPYLSGRTMEQDLKIGMERCDAIVVSGGDTAMGTELEKIKAYRKAVGSFPLVIGSGMTADTVREKLRWANGAIVGSFFKERGIAENTMEPGRVRQLMNRL